MSAGRYAVALLVFKSLEKRSRLSGRSCHLYIAEIEFMQGALRMEPIAYTKPLLENPEGTKRIGDINRLAGESYYRTGRFSEAVPYLEKAIARGAGVGRTERYQLGHAYYKAGEHQKALSQLTLVTTEEDSLSQLADAIRLIATSHLKEKNHARNAFKRIMNWVLMEGDRGCLLQLCQTRL
ncbi:MAG: hypothetical protein IPI41_09615 [Flavobacteriales bacterium]|nr:hypothetical protein [Flavobacteriales bacterium]